MSNDKQQTAVEKLVEQLPLIQQEGLRDVIEEAKEMEKEQIAKAFDDGDYNYYCSIQTGNDLDDGQEHYQEFNDGQDYYKKTYGGGEQ